MVALVFPALSAALKQTVYEPTDEKVTLGPLVTGLQVVPLVV